MKKEYIIIILSLSLVVIYFFFGNMYTPLVNYPPKNNTIVAFGDSLIEGRGSTGGNDMVSLLSKKIKKPIINLGVSGNTTGEGLARIEEVVKINPGTVIVLFGGNDYIRNIPKDEVFANLNKIISTLQSNGSFVILLGVRGGAIRDTFKSSFEDLAKEKGVAYVSDVLSPVFAKPEYMSDIVHPNDAGYVKVTEKIYDEIGKYLK